MKSPFSGSGGDAVEPLDRATRLELGARLTLARPDELEARRLPGRHVRVVGLGRVEDERVRCRDDALRAAVDEGDDGRRAYGHRDLGVVLDAVCVADDDADHVGRAGVERERSELERARIERRVVRDLDNL